MIRVDLANGYSEGYATMQEARDALIAATRAGESGAIVDDSGREIRIGDAAWNAWAAGVDWADREWEAHPDPIGSGAWRCDAIDARPLVDDADMAIVANEAARERWAAMLAEVQS